MSKRFAPYIVTGIALCFIAQTASAQTAVTTNVQATVQADVTTTTSPPPAKQPLRGIKDAIQETREARQEKKEDVAKVKNVFNNAVKDLKKSTQAQRDQLQQQFEKVRAEMKVELDAAKTPEERKAVMEKMKNAHLENKDKKVEVRANAQTQHQTLVDERKKSAQELRTQFRGTVKQQLNVALERVVTAAAVFKKAATDATITADKTALVSAIADFDAKVSTATTTIAKIPDAGEPAKDIVKAASQAVRDTIPAFNKMKEAYRKLQISIKTGTKATI
jgi:hypothetical protein